MSKENRKIKTDPAYDDVKVLFSHKPVPQKAFAKAIGCRASRIARLVALEVLTPGASGLVWMREYFAYQKGLAVGRMRLKTTRRKREE